MAIEMIEEEAQRLFDIDLSAVAIRKKYSIRQRSDLQKAKEVVRESISEVQSLKENLDELEKLYRKIYKEFLTVKPQ